MYVMYVLCMYRLIKIVYKKLINIYWLILHSLKETKYGPLLLSPLLLPQPTQMKFKQQQPQQQQKK